MPDNFLKNLLKSLIITVLGGGILFVIAALILYKSSASFDTYKYFSFIIVILLALIVSLTCAKGTKMLFGVIYELPLILFVFITAVAVPSGVSVKSAVLAGIIIVIGAVVPLLSNKTKKTKKRNMNKIRRDYERLRKK